LTFNNGAAQAFSLELQIDPPPPGIATVFSTAGLALGATQGAAPGETITLVVTALNQATAAAVVAAPSRIAVAEGGISIPVFTIQLAQDGSNDLLIQFVLTASVTGQQVPITVSLDGDLSMPYFIDIAAPSAPQTSNAPQSRASN
jgi:hypothetical protein